MCSIGAVFGLIGGIMQGAGAAQGHEQNAKSYELNAEGNDRDMQTTEQAADFEIAKETRNLRKELGTTRAGMAANGISLSGTAAKVIDDQASEGALDIAAIRWNSGVKIDNLKFERDTNLYNAGQERQAAGMAFFSGFLGGLGGAFS